MIYKILSVHFLFIFLSLTSTSTNGLKVTEFLCQKFPVPPSNDPETGVLSQDFNVTPTIHARIYAPSTKTTPFNSLPLILYFHGGGRFCSGSAFSRPYDRFSNSLSSTSRAVVISVQYRSVPPHPISSAYADSWAALKWVESHSKRVGNQPWLEDFIDFKRIFLAGDGVGANIAHNVAIRVGYVSLSGVELAGLVLIHPLLWGEKVKPIYESAMELKDRYWVSRMWRIACPTCSGLDDPWVNPAKDSKLWRLGCENVVVFVAGKDVAARGNYRYVAALRRSGWRGHVEAVEAPGREFGFYLNLNSVTVYDAWAMLKRVGDFIMKLRSNHGQNN